MGVVSWQYYSSTSRIISYGDSKLSGNLKFENYTSPNTEEEIFTLSIVNTTTSNKQFEFWCLYLNSTHSGHLIDSSAKLFVWTLPTGKPKCSFTGDISIINSNQERRPFHLTCSIEGGNPIPPLQWYQTDQNDLMKISDTGLYQKTTVIYSSASDHGREYICKAEIEAHLDEPLTCSLIPYNPRPEMRFTSKKTINTIGETISISCNNTGVSTVDISYLWYINDILINASIHDGIMITNTMSKSMIFISNYTFSSDNVEITCEGVIPNVASANASLILTVIQNNNLTTTDKTVLMTSSKLPSTDGSKLIIIGVAAAGGSFVIIIVVILICCACMKCNNSGKDIDKEYVETPSAEITTTPAPGTSNRSPMIPSNNESKTMEDNMVPLYADVSKVKNSDKVKANAEGLAYADIEIASKAQGKAGKDEIIRTENATVYAELKV